MNDFSNVLPYLQKSVEYLGCMDSGVQKCVKGVRKTGTPVNVPIIVAAATTILNSQGQMLLIKMVVIFVLPRQLL